jgi:uncharacterized protein (TIGR03086 family)
MEIVDLHRHACNTFVAAVVGIRSEQWTAPTPCPGWDARALVNHVVAEDLWTVALFAGATVDEVGARFDGDVLGDDPVAACGAAASDAVRAVGSPGALQGTVHLSFGDTPGEEYAWQLFADHLIHRWDLAVATGASTHLDPGAVEACAGWFATREELYRSAGAIGARRPVPAGADAQTHLLAAFGRGALTSA